MRHNVVELLHLGRHLGVLEGILTLKEPRHDDPGEPLDELSIKDLTWTLEKLLEHAENLELEVSMKLLQSCVKELPQTQRELEMIITVVGSELEGQTFPAIPKSRATYWDKDDLISASIQEHFPEIVFDIYACATAYACGLATASVFHSMRAAEIGVHRFAKALNIDCSGAQQQGTVIAQIEKKVTAIKNEKNSDEKISRQQFFSEALIDLRLFKDAYRNYVTHAKTNYDDRQAFKVMTAVLSFYEKVSDQQVSRVLHNSELT